MSFSLQAVVVGIIKQVYTIDFRINQLYRQKFAIQRGSATLGKERVQVTNSGRNSNYGSVMVFDRETGIYRPAYDRAEAARTMGIDPNAAAGAGITADGRYQLNSKEAVEAFYNAEEKKGHGFESEIDAELETLKATRTALNAQREELTKYVSEGIKQAFKNNYA